MGIFGGLFRQKPTAAPEKPKMTKVDFVDSFMLLQFYDGHHWQMSDEALNTYEASAGPELRKLMRFWTLMYLAFVFRKCIGGLQGEAFEEEMMASLYDRMRQVPVKPGEFNMGTAIHYWMDHLDLATKAAGTHSVGGEAVEMPACYFAGLTFLKFDPASPYYMKDDTPPAVTASVIRGLATLQDEMLPLVRKFAQNIEVP